MGEDQLFTAQPYTNLAELHSEKSLPKLRDMFKSFKLP